MSAQARANAAESSSTETNQDLILFRVGELLCAIDVLDAQEIKRHLAITRAPETDAYVRGLANLRGEVITIVDLRVVFEMGRLEDDSQNHVIVIRKDSNIVGLMVDDIVDIVSIDSNILTKPPANVSGVRGEFFEAVLKRSEDVAAVLNLSRVAQAS